MRLSANFTLSELTRTATGLPNEPEQWQVDNLRRLCQNVLQPLRERLGRPVHIKSGFRSEEVNEAVGGSPTSQHCFGYAADIKVDGLSAKELCGEALASASENHLGQVIYYHPSRGGHVHVGYGTTGRTQVLYAKKGGGYVDETKAWEA